MRISQRCFAITGLAYSAPWYVNAGFIAGDHTTLIVDTGGNAAAGATIHGYASIVSPSNQLRVINTERHFDHIGGNGLFRDRGIDIWGHEGIVRTAAEFESEKAAFNVSIPNTARRASEEARAFFERTEVVNPNRSISSDAHWDLGGVTVNILLTPGHTPTNLSVWVPSESVLYTGDCLINSYIPNLEAGGPEDWKDWLSSLDKIEALRAHTLMCGHGPVAIGNEVSEIIAEGRRVLLRALEQGRAPTSPLA